MENVNENASNEEEKVIPENEATNENESNNDGDDSGGDDGSGFDPSKFTEGNVVTKNDEESEDDSSNSGEEDDSSDGLEWAGYDNEEDVDDSATNDNKENDTEDEDNSSDDEVKSSLNDKQFQAFAEEIGLEAKTPKEFKEALIELESTVETLEARNKELEEKLSNSGAVTNEKVTKLNNLKSKEDEELVRLDLKQQGFSDEDIEEAIDTYTDNNLLGIEAKKIRKTIDRAITNEQKHIAQSTQEANAKQEQEREESVKLLTEHIKNTKTMFGMKIAKDDASLEKVQKGHLKYITSGNYLNDILKDSESLSQSAWLWKNKDVIIKAIGSENFNKGKESILNDIGNPEVSRTQRFKGPDSDDGFDPKKFVHGK